MAHDMTSPTQELIDRRLAEVAAELRAEDQDGRMVRTSTLLTHYTLAQIIETVLSRTDAAAGMREPYDHADDALRLNEPRTPLPSSPEGGDWPAGSDLNARLIRLGSIAGLQFSASVREVCHEAAARIEELERALRPFARVAENIDESAYLSRHAK